MQITVIYTTQLKSELGLGQETIDVPAPCSVSQLVEQLAAKHHLAFSRLAVDSDGKLLPSIMLCLNDKQIVVGERSATQGRRYVDVPVSD